MGKTKTRVTDSQEIVETVGTMIYRHDGRNPYVQGEMSVTSGKQILTVCNAGLPFRITRLYLSLDGAGVQGCGGAEDSCVTATLDGNVITISADIKSSVATLGWIGVGD